MLLQLFDFLLAFRRNDQMTKNEEQYWIKTNQKKKKKKW